MKSSRQFVSLFTSVVLLMVCIVSNTVYAETVELSPRQLQAEGIYFVGSSAPSCAASTGSASSATNLDYAGRPILNDAQLQAIAANQPIYEQAASAVGIPWQMLAVTHIIEHGLRKDNPSNGQGAYQLTSLASTGKYTELFKPGPISDDNFLEQSKLAANFLKDKAASNYPRNRTLDANSSPDTIKDTFYSYNGRAYAEQARSLGYDSDTQAYEGSPYVMNKADAPRDPEQSPTTWGQIKRDHGGIEYPANNFYGNYVLYAALTGAQIGCSTGGSSGTYVWPEAHSLSVTSCFGPRVHPVTHIQSFHYGLDVSNGEGTPILAAADGVVHFAGPVGGYGPNYVVIKHNNGFSTGYGHMRSKLVKVGDVVKQSQQIGEEGNEGVGTGSHLHFNVIPGNYSGSDHPNVDPLQNGLTIPAGVTNPDGCK